MKPKVAVISFPWKSYAPYKFLSDLLKILEPISDQIVLIGGNTNRINVTSEKVEIRDIGIGMHYLKDIKPKFYSAILWITKCVLVQMKASLELFKLSRDVNIVIFYAAYPYYLLPLLSAKVLDKKTLEIITYTPHIQSKSVSISDKICRLQNKILLSLIDYISPLSQSIFSQSNQDRYKNKILPIGARFIDTDSFKIKKNIGERENMVGYIGRFSEEKGIRNFADAIPIILKDCKNVKFLIGGDGVLYKEIKQNLRIYPPNKILFTKWIPHEKLPDYLNELKLFVLSSYSEGLPTGVLEAMACGTPVLATPVGGIPDVIKDGETGFIIEVNSPECIAENILKVLNHPHLDEIVKNARKVIEEEYDYRVAVKRYRKILSELQ